MIGHETLLALRMRGYRPAAVFVCLTEPRDYTVFSHPDMVMSLGGLPEIDVFPDDALKTVDLRVLAGLSVHISGPEGRQVKALFKRVLDFSPADVTACALDSTGILRYENGEIRRLEVA